MMKNIMKAIVITGLSVILSSSMVFADTDPTNDTTRKIRLTTSATDNIDKPEDLYFAWYYNKVQSDGSIRKIPLTENTDENDKKNYQTPFVKGTSAASVVITMSKYGNGVYIAECKDQYGNISSENIEIMAWDITGPADVIYQITPDNNTPSSHKTIRILATENDSEDSGLAEKPYSIYGPVEPSYYDANIKGKSASELTSFISNKRASEPSLMSDWTDSTLTVDKEGYYALFVKDAAGNISHTLAKVEKIDISIPEIEGIDVLCTDDCITDTEYNEEIFNPSTAPNVVKLHVVVSDNCTANEDLKYIWYKDGYQIAQGVGLDTIYLSPDSKDDLAAAIGGEQFAKLPSAGTICNVTDNSLGVNFNANGKYKVSVEDVCNNKATSNVRILKIFDFTDPQMDNPTYNTDEATKSNTIRVPAITDNMGFDEKPLSYHKRGEEGERTSNKIYTVPENGVYDIDLFDAAGNKITKSVTINNLDTTTPVIEDYAFSNNSGKVRITVTATDTNSNGDDTSSRLQYCLATSSGELETSAYWQDSNVIDKIGDADITSMTYWLGVRDRAGNMTYQFISVNKDYICGTLESMSPENLKGYITQSPEVDVWTNGDVDLTVNLPSIIENPRFDFNDKGYQTSNKRSFASNGSVVVKVKDIYDNVYTADAYSIKNIDKVLPDIETQQNDKSNKVTISVSDELSKLHKITVIVPDEEEVTIQDYSGVEKSSDTIEYLVPKNGNYTFKVYDNAGNVKSSDEVISGAITDNAELNAETIAARILKSPVTWTNGDVTLKLAFNSTAGLDEKPYKWVGQTEYNTNNEFVVTENGMYTVTVKDSYGNEITSNEVTVDNIDKVRPVITFRLNDNSNKVMITAEDDLSNIQKITIEGGTYTEETTIKDAGGSLDYKVLATEWSVPVSNTTYNIRAYDNAGNVEMIEVEVGISKTDNEDLTPENLLSLITQTPTAWTNTDVTLTLALTNTNELDDNPYSWNNGETWSTSRAAVVTKNGDYVVHVKDRYGNVIVSNRYTVSNIDKTNPSMELNYKDEKKNTVVFTLSDAVSGDETGMSGIDRLMLCTTEDGVTNETLIYEELSSEKEVSTAEWVIPQNGDYVFKLYDNAGNSIVEDVTFDGAIAYNDELNEDTLALRVSKAPNDWTNGSVKLQLTLNDTSNLADKPFRWGYYTQRGSEKTLNYIDSEFTDKNYTTVRLNGLYFVVVKDKYGNETISSGISVYNIDVETYGYGSPYINVYDDVKVIGARIWDNGTVTFNLTDVDPIENSGEYTGYARNCNSGLAKVTVQGGTFTEETVIKEFADHPLNASVSFRAPVIGTYTIRSYDVVGNVFEWDITVPHAITDNAEINDPDELKSRIRSDAEGKEWVAGPVRLSIDLSSFDGLAANPFKWSTQDGYSNINYVDVDENGSYSITVKDVYDNENISSPYVVSNIDNVKPTLTLGKSDDGTQLIYSSSDAESGVIRIVWSGGALDTLTPIRTWSEPQASVEGSVPFPNNGEYTITVYDAVGNSFSSNISVEGITAPNSLLDDEGYGVTSAISKSPTLWTNGNVIVSIDLPDKTGVDPNGYKWSYSAGVTEETQEFIGTKTNRTSIVATENGVAKVVVTDSYGKEFTSGDIIIDNIDKVAPTGSVAVKDEYQNTFVLSLRDMPPEGETDVSGIDKVVLCKEIAGEISETVLYNETDAEVDAIDVEWTIPAVGKYVFKVYDRAGNVSTFESDEITAIYTYNDEINDPATLAGKIRSNQEGIEWTPGPVRLSLDLSSFEGLASAPFKWSTQDEYSTVNYVDVYENGDYGITVMDVYGNEHVSDSITISNIDNVKPLMELSKSEDGTKLIYSAQDESSGVTRIVWEGGALSGLTPIQTWPSPQNEVSGSIPFPNNGEYTVSVYDACGNVEAMTISVEGISAPNNLLDENGEGVTASVNISPTDWTNGNVTVSIDMANKTGVDPNGYLWAVDAPVTSETETYIGVKGDRTSIILTDNGSARVTVTDDYGKEFTSDEIIIDNIDKIFPDIDLTPNNNSNVIYVHTVDNLSGISKICYKFDDGPETTVCSLSSHLLEYVKEIPVEQNGVYSVYVYDNAGNVNVETIEITTAATDVLSDEYVTQHIKYSTNGYTNGDVTVILDIPDKNLLDLQPYSWDGGATWSTTNTYVVSENGTYKVLVKDKYGNIYTGKAIVSNIDHADPTLSLFQNGNMLQITAGDNAQIGKITMNLPNDRYEETIRTYREGAIFDTFTVNLTKNGVHTVTVYDYAGNKTVRTIDISGLSSGQDPGNGSPLLDENSIYTNGEKDFNNTPANNGNANNNNTNTNNSNNGQTNTTGNTNSGIDYTDILKTLVEGFVSNNKNSNNTQNTNTSSTGGMGSVVKEYHYDTNEKDGVTVVEKYTNNSNTASNTQTTYGQQTYTPQYTQPVSNTTTYQQPVSTSPAIKITPAPSLTTSSVTTTPTPAPTKTANKTASSSVSTASNTAAKKVAPTTTVTSSTTTSTSADIVVEDKTQDEENLDAKAMYRNNRVEQAEQEEKTARNPLVGLIIFGSVLGIALIGVGIYAYAKRKEQKQKIVEQEV